MNRLKLNMKLQIDATVIFALTEGKKDLKRNLKALSNQINQEKKNKKDVAQQNKKLEDLTQLVSDLQLSIKSKEESNLKVDFSMPLS